MELSIQTEIQAKTINPIFLNSLSLLTLSHVRTPHLKWQQPKEVDADLSSCNKLQAGALTANQIKQKIQMQHPNKMALTMVDFEV